MGFDSLLSQLDPDKRGPQFERLCRWYLTNAPEYRGRFKRVWLWAEWPGAWGPDAGIDLVAEEQDGGLWAIQAKAYDPAYAIKKADVDSFLSESARPGFVYRLLIATTDLIGGRARRTIQEQERPAGLRLRSQLEETPVAWPRSPAALRPPRRRPCTPRLHQRQGLRDIESGFESSDRGQAIMACGTGKTLVGLWAAEGVEAQRTLVLLPSLSLIAQTLREWAANASAPFQYLAVCSDETVIGDDQFVSHTAELGFPVTTDPAVIAAFQRQRGRRVIFSTYQSSPRIAAAFQDPTPRFDLAIADEAHRCAGQASADFKTILDSDQIRARRRLFMTATPRYFTRRIRREAGQLDVDIASMDDEEAFGPVFHRLTFGEAIERDLLSDYQVVVVGVIDSMYRRWAEQGEFVTLDGQRVTDARSLAGQIGLAKTMRRYDLKRVVSFHSRVPAARRFAAELPAVIAWLPRSSRPSGSLWAEHVSGMMSSGLRDARLRRLRAVEDGERGLLTNARCLGEGIDVPTLDGVAFIDPRRSTIDIIQALGRAIRKTDDEKPGTIVIPVFIDDDADPEEALDTSAFKHVWDVLKALRAHDDQLAKELDELRRGLGARSALPRRPGKIKLDLPREVVGQEFATAFDARLVEQTTSSWEFWLGVLRRYVAEHGNALVPALYTDEAGHRLGQWVNVQRTLNADGRLPPERIARLEEIDGWLWDVLDAKWEEGFATLERYVARNGNAQVPQDYMDEDGYRLGVWVAIQRGARRERRLPRDRESRLSALAADWVRGQDLDARWNERLDHLRRYAHEHGDTLVPTTYEIDGFNLGQWVRWQRFQYRRGRLSPERQQALNDIREWVWDADPFAEQWARGFAALARFVAREENASVPAKHQEGDFPLGKWVNRQRRAYATDKLSPERVKRLSSVDGWVWDEREAAWDNGFKMLLRYFKREGHSEVPATYKEGHYSLGAWVSKQRSDGRTGRLNKERRRRLRDAFPDWRWSLRMQKPPRSER